MPDIAFQLVAKQPSGVAELADLLFSGLSERPLWKAFLERVAARLGTHCAAFVISNGQGPGEIAVLSAQLQLDNRYACLVKDQAFKDLPFETPSIVTATDTNSQSCAERSEYVTLKLRLDKDRAIWLICTQSVQSEAALADDWQAVLLALLPLLQRVVRLYLVIGEGERRLRIAEHVLETSGVGVILVDSTGSVVIANTAANSILAQCHVLHVRDGRLQARRRADHDLLQKHIEQMAEQQSALAADPDCYATIALVRDDHPLPLTVMVRPGPPFGPASAPLRRTATVILRDPGRRLKLAVSDLQKLFDLSPAEARLAQLLAEGQSTEEAAMNLGVSRNTIRTQLQAIFAKTNSNRQGDLVRLLLSSAATLTQRDDNAIAPN